RTRSLSMRCSSLSVRSISEYRLRSRSAADRLRPRAALEQATISDALDQRRQLGRRSPPAKLVDVVEERRVGPQRRQLLEEQCLNATLAEHVRREGLDGSVSVEQPRRTDRAQPRDPRITVRAVAYEREKIGDQRRFDAELCAH